MRAVVFRHGVSEDLGLLRPALEQHGVAVEFADLYHEGATLPDLAEAAGLIFMGGTMFANDDLPFLQTELKTIQSAAAKSQPVLGLCLGAQLIGKALGAKVYRNPVKEVGWFDVHWTDAARHDPLFAGLDGSETLMQWHYDTFDLPAGATHLAWSETCRNQAFRAATSVYGLQFHLEATPSIIADWCIKDSGCAEPELDAPIDPERDRAHLASLSKLVFGRWCALLK
jgi:GMP synthase (glutamine-hydrolysing)